MENDTIAGLLASIDGAAADAYGSGRFDCLRSGFLVAVTFAKFSANCRVEMAERDTVRYVRDGLGFHYLRHSRQQTLSALFALPASSVANIYRATPREQVMILDSVPGFGPCKAAFALACAGFARLPCLDTWVSKKHGLDATRDVYRLGTLRVDRAADRYLTLCDRVYPTGDARLAQWTEYAAMVPAYRESLHRPVIDLILAGYRGELRYPAHEGRTE